jgi:anti-sigma factor RsiW
MTEIHVACVDVVELVTDYLEGSLDPATARAVEAHLALCPGCLIYVEQMRQTIAALGRVPVETLSEQAQVDLVEAFRGYRHTTA